MMVIGKIYCVFSGSQSKLLFFSCSRYSKFRLKLGVFLVQLLWSLFIVCQIKSTKITIFKEVCKKILPVDLL